MEIINLMMGLFEQQYDQFLDFCSHTPAQRYLRLLDRYPRITEIASYGDIASYLNISRRQFQRIREKYFRSFVRKFVNSTSF